MSRRLNLIDRDKDRRQDETMRRITFDAMLTTIPVDMANDDRMLIPHLMSTGHFSVPEIMENVEQIKERRNAQS